MNSAAVMLGAQRSAPIVSTLGQVGKPHECHETSHGIEQVTRGYTIESCGPPDCHRDFDRPLLTLHIENS